MKDMPVTKENHEEISKIGCGNALVLEHANGYQSNYCHMKDGSIQLAVGDPVRAGQQIGAVGLSGLTEYPHLHFGLRRDGKRIDPFDGQSAKSSCGAGSGASLWNDPLPYTEMDLMPLVFSSKPLTRQTRWQAPVPTIEKNAPAMILTGRAWNLIKGDIWQFRILRPDGSEASERQIAVKENRQSQWYANRLFQPDGGFMLGTWKGHLVVERHQQDGQILRFESETEVLVTD